VEDLVDDVGFLRARRRLQRHGLGDGVELVALFVSSTDRSSCGSAVIGLLFS